MAFESFKGTSTTPCTPTLNAPCQINGYTSGGSGTSASGNTNWWASNSLGNYATAYSGKNSLQFQANGSYIILPKIISAGNVTLSFFYRNTVGTTASNLIVEYITSSYTGGDPASLPWAQLGSPVNSTLASWSSSNFFTATFTPGTGYTIRIRRTNSAAVAPDIDDLAWTSSVPSENNIIVPPTQFVATTGATCTTATLSASSSYSFYDNGGLSDNYGGVANQNHTITFTPATGQIVQLTVNSLNITSPNTGTLYITGTDNTVAASGFKISDGLVDSFNPPSQSATTPSKFFNSTRCDGTVTVNFTTTNNNAAGFDITVKSVAVSCPSPTSFQVTSGSITQTAAAFTWTAPCPAPTEGYDYYISATDDTAILPNSSTAVFNSTTSQLLVGTVANTQSTLSVTNLNSGQTYYAWIRSNCSSGTYSNWTSVVSFTTLCPSIPVPGTYTLDFQSSPAIPSCTTMFPPSAFNNGNNGTDNHILSTSFGAWYVTQPLSLTAGTTYSFSFNASVNNTASPQSFEVKYYSTNGVITSTGMDGGTPVFTGTTSTVNNAFTNFSSTFSPPTSGTYYIGIHMTSSSVNIRLDNIVVKVACVPKTWYGNSWSTSGTPTFNDDLIFNDDYTGQPNSVLNGCSCTVNSGKNVTFTSGALLSLEEKVTVLSGGNLTFNNNSSLVQSNSVGNSGNITYIRNTTNVVKNDYTYWSSPVTPFTLSQLSPNTNTSEGLFKYDPLIPNWQLIASSTPMEAGVGYIVRVPDTTTTNPLAAVPYTASFFGVPNNGTYTTPVLGGQVNLIGNPYPSAISALSLVDDNDTIIEGTLYFWSHNTPRTANIYEYNDYALWNKLGGTGTRRAINNGVNETIPDGTIAAGQSFFIEGLTDGKATFKNSMRLSSGNASFYRTASLSNSSQYIERHRIWLDIYNTEGAYKQLLIGYIEGGTMGIDRSFDAEIFDVGNPILLYSLVENKKLNIQGRGLPFNENDTVSLGYKSAYNGDFSISLSNFDGLFTGQNIYLEDKLLNIIYDLKSGSYTFSTLAGLFEDRFVLRFTTTALGIGATVFSQNTVLVYENESGIHVNTGVIPMSSVRIYDITGRLITEQNAIGNTQTHFKDVLATKQVLILKITAVDGVVVTKKIVY